METERIAFGQRERDRLRVLQEVRQKHLTQVAAVQRPVGAGKSQSSILEVSSGFPRKGVVDSSIR